LGVLHKEGWGVAQDYCNAREWFQKAADAGNAYAMYGLGWMYEKGEGVILDYTKVLDWYQKAAAAGSADGKQAASLLRSK
jgi:uncharacterized protein